MPPVIRIGRDEPFDTELRPTSARQARGGFDTAVLAGVGLPLELHPTGLLAAYPLVALVGSERVSALLAGTGLWGAPLALPAPVVHACLVEPLAWPSAVRKRLRAFPTEPFTHPSTSFRTSPTSTVRGVPG